MRTIMPYGPAITVERDHVQEFYEAGGHTLIVWDEREDRVLVTTPMHALDASRMIIAGYEDRAWLEAITDVAEDADPYAVMAATFTEGARRDLRDWPTTRTLQAIWHDLRDELDQRDIHLAAAPETAAAGFLTDTYRWTEDPALKVRLDLGMNLASPAQAVIEADDDRGRITELTLGVSGPRRSLAVTTIAGALQTALGAIAGLPY
ncbi:hypothetical protein [Nocardiopsis composta]|uniref:Uncharacterized protein n=1 Tax=Nocardiopsis composta TaxID=157465 RepID=A0A7W8QRD8_9ACTN|nr:hypothetical protein [Nocardiopsis composta]MBB5435215.1 hypothetical protein [Nocardiopsis composta]